MLVLSLGLAAEPVFLTPLSSPALISLWLNGDLCLHPNSAICKLWICSFFSAKTEGFYESKFSKNGSCLLPVQGEQPRGMTLGLSVGNSSASQPKQHLLFKAFTHILARQQLSFRLCQRHPLPPGHQQPGLERAPLKMLICFHHSSWGKKTSLCGLRCGQNCQAIRSAVVFFVHHLNCPQFC